MQHEITHDLAQLEHVFSILHDAVIVVDQQFQIVLCNKAAEKLFGYSKPELLGQPLNLLIPQRLRKFHDQMASAYMQNGEPTMMGAGRVLSAVSKGGAEIPVSISLCRVTLGNENYAITVVRDAALISAHIDHIQAQVERDVLTGLGNRLALSKAIQLQLQHPASRGFSILFLDLTNFKAFNDQHGHNNGDQALQVFAQRIETLIRVQDCAARIGGDEFVLVFVGINSAPIVLERARQIARVLAKPFIIGKLAGQLSVNIGCVLSPQHGNTEAELLEKADQAMYTAKKSGTQVCLYQPP